MRMLLERDGELGRLVGLLGEVADGGGRVVLILGHAGVGKTALVSRFLAEVGDRTHILLGYCDDLITPQPLGPFWDLARDEPLLRSVLEAGDVRAVMEAVMELMTRRLRATVVAIEDVQWADEATLDVVRYVGRRIGTSSGILLMTYRSGEVDNDHPLRQVIGQLEPRHVVRFALPPLSEAAVAEMLGGSELDIGDVMALTGGNPLFVSEVLDWGIDGVPPSIRDAVLTRAGHLSSDARSFLDAMAVMPGRVSQALVEHLGGLSPDVEVECAGFLEIDREGVRFRHELTRRAIESTLTSNARRHLNQLVLDALNGSAAPAVLVHHAKEAGDDGMIVEYAPQAARAASAVGSNTEALSHFHQMAPYLDDLSPLEAADLLFDQAKCEVALGCGETPTLSRAIDLYRVSGSAPALGRALTFAIRFHVDRGRLDDGARCAAEAVALLEPEGPSADLARAYTQQAAMYMLRAEYDKAVDLADAAATMAASVGDEWASIDATITRAGVSIMLGRDELATFEACRERAEKGSMPDLELRALINLAMNAGLFRGIPQAIDLCLRTIAAARRWESVGVEVGATIWLGKSLMAAGRWSEAEKTLLDVADPVGSLLSRATAELGLLEARTGRFQRAADTVRRAVEAAVATGQPQNVLDAGAAAAEYAWLTGDRDAAAVEAAEEAWEMSGRLGLGPYSRSALGYWLWRLGRIDAPDPVIDEAYALMIRGEAAGAAAVWERRGQPYERALALVEAGDAAAVEALGIFEELGANALAERTRCELRGRGVSLPRRRSPPRRADADLTERQSEVLELLAEGLTSPEIAERLFLSRRTVESHVGAILMRLGVSNRREAVRTARRRGLLPAH
jgi:DNA-binding CsgD family transcriptional regulator/tetratricopeptide (TPR) repeat protein